jgi:plastocyanin
MRRCLPALLFAVALPTALAVVAPLVVPLVVPLVAPLAAGIATVSQKGRAFAVRDVQIARGDTVRFENDDEFTHQIYVQSPSFAFESVEQPPGDAVNVRFTAGGTFEVRCHIHPKMLLHVDAR